jgi:NADH dehydrogenase/NADH:ubiquinone oxidoreductase subunit G
VSPQLCNEDLFVAQQFAREVLGTEAILSPVIFDLGGDLRSFVDLVVLSEPVDIIDTAAGILTIGLDTTYGFTPVGIAAKKAAKRGAVLVTVGDDECNLDMLSEEAFQSDAAKWPDFLDGIMKSMSGNGTRKKAAPSFFKKGEKNVVIIGPDAIFSGKRKEIFEGVLKMRDSLGWKVIVCHPYTNLMGMLAMGAFPGLKPGGLKSDGALKLKDPAAVVDLKQNRKVGYFIGEVPSPEMPKCDYIIYENALPAPSGIDPDLILPASLFTEAPGTTISCEGRILAYNRASAPFAESKPDWWIMCAIAARMKKGSLKYNSLAAIQTEIKKSIPGFSGKDKRVPRKKVVMEGKAAARNPHGLGRVMSPSESFRGVPLHDHVAGMKAIEERRRK